MGETYNLDYFKSLLLDIRNNIVNEFEKKENGFNQTMKDSAGEHSSYSFHLADHGTDTNEREKSFFVAEMESDVLNEIESALQKINSGEFGICEHCSGTINNARLEAIPYARLCLNCKSNEEFSQ